MNNQKLILSCQIPNGKTAVIRELRGNISTVSRLREIGFYEGMEISKFYSAKKDCIILNIKRNKIYLNDVAAHCILVEVV
jgi:Fe2+ transport system protein FeoA